MTNTVSGLVPFAGRALLLAAAGLLTVAVAAQTGVTPHSGNGTLTVSVPEGTGIMAWVYLDGKLLASPPSGDREGVRGRRNKCDGWELTDANGLTLTTHLGKYENLASYIKHVSANKSLFSARERSLPAGRYTIDAAFLWQGTHCDQMHPRQDGFFPILFSAKYTATVIPGRKTEIYIALPDGYDPGSPMMAAPVPSRAGGCTLVKGGQPSEDSLAALESSVEKFERDPQVVALLRAAASHAAEPRNSVELDLPADRGGRREFNGAQLNYIVDVLVSGDPVWWTLPGHDEVATCRNRYPQFAKTFAKYDELIDFVGGQAESIRKLETSLNGSRHTADEPADEP